VRAEYSFDAGVAPQVCLPLVVRQGSVQEIRPHQRTWAEKEGRSPSMASTRLAKTSLRDLVGTAETN
jgi:hypothetical protein